MATENELRNPSMKLHQSSMVAENLAGAPPARDRGRQRHVEIAGAGLAGLACAAALAQRGWKVRVHEKSKQLREIGAGLY